MMAITRSKDASLRTLQRWVRSRWRLACLNRLDPFTLRRLCRLRHVWVDRHGSVVTGFDRASWLHYVRTTPPARRRNPITRQRIAYLAHIVPPPAPPAFEMLFLEEEFGRQIHRLQDVLRQGGLSEQQRSAMFDQLLRTCHVTWTQLRYAERTPYLRTLRLHAAQQLERCGAAPPFCRALLDILAVD
jgi:hypothetical protein